MHTVFVACRAPGSNLANLFLGGTDRMSFRPGSKNFTSYQNRCCCCSQEETNKEKKNGYNKNCSSPFFFAVVVTLSWSSSSFFSLRLLLRTCVCVAVL